MKRSPLKRRKSKRAPTPDEVEARGACEARTPACTGRGAQGHHIVLRSQGGTEVPANYLWVCLACHGYIHGHPDESYANGWMRHAPVDLGLAGEW